MSHKIASALTAAALCLVPVAAQSAEKPAAQRLTAIENDPQFKEARELRRLQLEDMRVVAATGRDSLIGQMYDIVGDQFGRISIDSLARAYFAKNQQRPTKAQAEASLRAISLTQGVLGGAGFFTRSYDDDGKAIFGLYDRLEKWCGGKPNDADELCTSYLAWRAMGDLPNVMESASGSETVGGSVLLEDEVPAPIKMPVPRQASKKPAVGDLELAAGLIDEQTILVSDILFFGGERQIRAAKPMSPKTVNDDFMRDVQSIDREWVDPAERLQDLKVSWAKLAKIYERSDADLAKSCKALADAGKRDSWCTSYLGWRGKIVGGVFLGGYGDAPAQTAGTATLPGCWAPERPATASGVECALKVLRK